MKSSLIPLPTIKNCRDLGGIVNKEGYAIKEKMLVRSGYLAHANDDDLQILHNDYHVCDVYDLRSRMEKTQSPDQLIDGMYYHDVMIQEESEFAASQDEESIRKRKEFFEEMKRRIGDNIEKAIEHMSGFYRYLGSIECSFNGYASFLNGVLNSENGVLWHCSLGKDRCGIATVLILSILDVDEQTILEDYLYSNMIINGRQEIQTAQEAGFFAHKDFLKAYYDSVNTVAGSMENFLIKLGIDEQMKNKFKEKYLEGWKEGHKND